MKNSFFQTVIRLYVFKSLRKYCRVVYAVIITSIRVLSVKEYFEENVSISFCLYNLVDHIATRLKLNLALVELLLD